MTTPIAQAEPYAKAIFDLALHDNKLSEWHQILKMMAEVALVCKENQLLDNPKVNATQEIDFFAEIINQSPEAMNLIRLLAERKKLSMLPEVAAGYQKLFFANNKMLEVEVFSASELTSVQKERLLSALNQRYQGEILLQYHVDEKLIGGAVMHIEDKVIDSSISGMLQLLKQNLLLKNAHAKTK
jgi:F-type H+-transporting ATPase subunit delta